MPVRVDRCICFKRPFDELYAIAQKCGARTLEDLQLETEFGMSCRICNPYVRKMLQTGQTVFTEILDDPLVPPKP
jgi:hypothetical protein